jgi:hypothetical protein
MLGEVPDTVLGANLNPDVCIDRLRRGPETFTALLAGLDDEPARWRPAPGKWSILEVVCHLADEEREDFRTRLDSTLHRPDDPWPGIDPEGWVTERGYQDRELAPSLEDFLQERERSLAWLDSLTNPDWGRVHEHPRLGRMRAADVLVSWAAHDLLHFRQMVGLHYGRLVEASAPASAGYAGPW